MFRARSGWEVEKHPLGRADGRTAVALEVLRLLRWPVALCDEVVGTSLKSIAVKVLQAAGPAHADVRGFCDLGVRGRSKTIGAPVQDAGTFYYFNAKQVYSPVKNSAF